MILKQTKLWFIVALAIVLRVSLRFSAYFEEIANRVEISSPVNAWKRVVEGVTLQRIQISPYDGDTFHESPLFLYFYRLLIDNFSEYQIVAFFVCIDIATAFLLGKLCATQLHVIGRIERQRIRSHVIANKKEDDCNNAAEALSVRPDSVPISAYWTIAIYLLSPYSMLACVAQNTSVIGNFMIAFTLLAGTAGWRITSLFVFALLSFNDFYPLILLPSIILFFEQKRRLRDATVSETSETKKRTKNSDDTNDLNLRIDLRSSNTQFSILFSLILFVSFYVTFLAISFVLENRSLQFLQSTYVFMWKVADLTPNIGLFWYFFTEMFDHFRDFFLWVFQINFFIYIIPLTINFWYNPYFISMISLIMHALFKPYPTISDVALYMALLPQWRNLFDDMKSTLVIACTIVTCTVFAPILWYLWIVLGTANSNFYFGITLAFNVAQIFLTTDLMFSFVKREFYINNFNLFKLCKKAKKSPKIELSF